VLSPPLSARIGDLTDAMVEEYGGVTRFAKMIVETGVNAFSAAEKALQELPLTRSWGKTTVTLKPVGVAGFITAWNANSLFIGLKLASAVAAGCSVVIKPSELSALQTQVFLVCLQAAGLPRHPGADSTIPASDANTADMGLKRFLKPGRFSNHNEPAE
jgi:aldehyde dehydrogenase (NAD+)